MRIPRNENTTTNDASFGVDLQIHIPNANGDVDVSLIISGVEEDGDFIEGPQSPADDAFNIQLNSALAQGQEVHVRLQAMMSNGDTNYPVLTLSRTNEPPMT